MVLLSIATDLRAATALQLPHHRPSSTDEERNAVVGYLAQEYRREAKTWITTAPLFDDSAAWYAFELLIDALYYYHGPTAEVPADGEALPENPLQPYSGQQTAGAVLSADLNLRFLAAFRSRIRQIDADAIEGSHIDEVLEKWSYSALLDNDLKLFQLDNWVEDRCVSQCFVDRVIERRHLTAAKHPLLNPLIQEALGAHASYLWPSFTLEAL
ncbi:MAG: hypothetical protein AB8F78_09220 [Saprospiraceae bacterium]